MASFRQRPPYRGSADALIVRSNVISQGATVGGSRV
jgi:hypothetical protein